MRRERPWYATMATAIRRIAGDVASAAKCLPRASQRQAPVLPDQILDPTKLHPTNFRACDRQLVLHRRPRTLDTHSLPDYVQAIRGTLPEHRPELSADPKRDERRQHYDRSPLVD